MIDISFNNSSYFVSIVSVAASTDDTGVSAEILFRVDIDHLSTFRRSEGIVTIILLERFECIRVLTPVHFGTDKLKSRQSVSEIGFTSFGSHEK